MLKNGFLTILNKLNGVINQEVMAAELLNLYLSIQLMARVNPNQQALDRQVKQSSG